MKGANMKRVWMCCAIAGLLVLVRPSGKAQSEIDSSSGRLGWVTVGGGYGGGKNFSGGGGSATASYLDGKNLYSVRFLVLGSIAVDPTPNPLEGELKSKGASDLSALFGLAHKGSLLFLSASTGLGIVWITEKGPFGQRRTTTIGVPLEVQVYFTPLRVLGIGVSFSGNINGRRSYGGVFAGLQIGKLK